MTERNMRIKRAHDSIMNQDTLLVGVPQKSLSHAASNLEDSGSGIGIFIRARRSKHLRKSKIFFTLRQ